MPKNQNGAKSYPHIHIECVKLYQVRKYHLTIMRQWVYTQIMSKIFSILFIFLGSFSFTVYAGTQEPEKELVSPLASVQPSPSPTPTPTPSPEPPKTVKYVGEASYYSREGCVGCSESLTMANGQPLDDSALTVAYNRAPLNSYVTITNLKTKQSVTAKVTDTGGFEKLGRIVDLTIATKNAIGCGSLCHVEVSHE